MVIVNIKEVKERARTFIAKANIGDAGDKIYLIIKNKDKTYSTPTDLAQDLINETGKDNSPFWQSGTNRADLVGEVTI